MWNTLIVNPFTNILLLIYQLVGGNFGIAIILFTILIRLITHPLMASQIKAGAKMQEMQNSKEMQAIQRKYKDNKEKLQMEQMKYYQSIGYNPFSSCLPTLIQFPIIIGLYQSIMHAMVASPRQLLDLTRIVYPFLFKVSEIVPVNSRFLWMNLGQPERVSILGTAVPVLAIIVAITTYIQSKVTMPATAAPGNQGAAMGNMMAIYMPLLLGYFTWISPSGLGIYFLAGNLIGVAQYAMLGKVDWKALLPGKRAEQKPPVRPK